MATMIADLRPNSCDTNYEKTSTWEGARCELCWKPIKDLANASHVKVNHDDLELPENESDVGAFTQNIPVGSDCLKKLKRFAKSEGFVVILAEADPR